MTKFFWHHASIGLPLPEKYERTESSVPAIGVNSAAFLISLLPAFAFLALGTSQQFPFGGTSILIVVGVGLDTVKQIQSQLQQRNYEGFLR